MPRFVALLRGVNVGGAKRVPMAQFRALLAGLGYTGISTVLNSGNAVFTAARGTPDGHARRISAAIGARLNLQVPVIVRSAREFLAVVADNPITAPEEHHPRLLVTFIQDTRLLRDWSAIGPQVAAPERFAVGKVAAYLLCANGILESKAWALLLKQAGGSTTTRNWATVLKLAALTEARDI
jgi:uncharacterized protein (DUF1697 family)